MYIHLRMLIISIIFLFSFSCSIFNADDPDIVEVFTVVPSEYFGIELSGVVKFSNKVTHLEWSSASGQIVFDNKSNLDTLLGDSVKIYYNKVPLITVYNKTIDTTGKETIDTLNVMKEKDTVFIRFLYQGKIQTYQKSITLKNFKPSIDSFAVLNGNFVEYNNKHYASFLIGSGVAKIKAYATDMLKDSVTVYWSSKSGLLSSKELNSYVPFEFKVPDGLSSDVIYVRVTNSYGASNLDSIIVSMYKERGSIWVTDETSNLYKFSSEGNLINKIDSVYPKEIAFDAKTNVLIALCRDSLRAFYTDGSILNYDNSELVGFDGEKHLYKLDGIVYLTIYALNKTSIFRYENNKFSAIFNYSGHLTQFTKSYNYFFGIKNDIDSSFIVMFRGDSLLSRHRGFLHINKVDVDSKNKRLFLSDDQENKIFIYNYEKDSMAFEISGFSKPIDFVINPLTSNIFCLDESSSIIILDGNSLNSDLNIASYLGKDALSLEKPSYINVNKLDDGSGSGNIWICDTHNNRILKINSSALILSEIIGFFHFPRSLTINEGL